MSNHEEALRLIGVTDEDVYRWKAAWSKRQAENDDEPLWLQTLVLHVMRAMRDAIEARKHLVTGFEVTRAAFWLDGPFWQAMNAALEEKP